MLWDEKPKVVKVWTQERLRTSIFPKDPFGKNMVLLGAVFSQNEVGAIALAKMRQLAVRRGRWVGVLV